MLFTSCLCLNTFENNIPKGTGQVPKGTAASTSPMTTVTRNKTPVAGPAHPPTIPYQSSSYINQPFFALFHRRGSVSLI